ncbi:ATP-binding protein [Sphaerisporangium perillae]|uniref:ATP-binding protein n=1 Tax=Sphaerisporangium perillae TaxID=2935860 RepID=UPI00200EA54E|nr:ATP-binding protein [Sphaerisporangium perillae]
MISIPSRPREARWELPADPGVTARCRAVVRETLTEWDLRDLIDDAVIVVTELLANALIHGGPPVHLALAAVRDSLTGSVTDQGPGWPRLRTAGTEHEHGRGLRIVAALTDRWGVEPVPAGAGKAIWFTLTRRPAGEGAGQYPTPVSTPPSTVNSLPVQ